MPELAARLRTLDPAAAATIDLRNKRRVVRAVEVCVATGGRFSYHRTAWSADRPPVHGVWLLRDTEDLMVRIRARTDRLLDEEALEEVRVARRTPMSDTASRIIGWNEVCAFLDGKMSRADCLEQIRLVTRRYAKRQMTWFRGETFAETVNLSVDPDVHARAREIAAKIGATPRDKASRT